MDLFLIELLVSRCASIDVLQLETYGILVLGTLRVAASCSYPRVQNPGVFAFCRAVGLIPKDLGFAPCAFSPPGLSSASDRGRRRLWELVGLSSVTLSMSAAARFAQTGSGSLPTVESNLLVGNHLRLTPDTTWEILTFLWAIKV